MSDKNIHEGSFFEDLSDPTQFKTAANWVNYQPLWPKDNLSKGANYAR